MTTHVQLYSERGVKLTNDRWSWGGMDRHGKVILTVWFDGFRDGAYHFKGRKADRKATAAVNEVIRLVKHALHHNNGVVGAIMIHAESTKPGSVRKVAAARNVPDMRITSFDEKTGDYTAEWA